MAVPTRTLIADDDVDVRFLLRRHLESSGLFVVVAEAQDGHGAIAAAEQQQPDLTVLDMLMPGMDGLSALPRIRAVAPDCTVAVLSGLSTTEQRREAYAAGAAAYMRKSSHWVRVVQDLVELVQGSRQEDSDDAVDECRLRLPAALTSGGQARAFLRQSLSAWGLVELLDETLLLTSELINNAVLHAGSAIHVRLRRQPERLHVEVSDEGGGALAAQDAGPDDTSGRGLFLVEAMSAAWGTATTPAGKNVWFELALPSQT